MLKFCLYRSCFFNDGEWWIILGSSVYHTLSQCHWCTWHNGSQQMNDPDKLACKSCFCRTLSRFDVKGPDRKGSFCFWNFDSSLSITAISFFVFCCSSDPCGKVASLCSFLAFFLTSCFAFCLLMMNEPNFVLSSTFYLLFARTSAIWRSILWHSFSNISWCRLTMPSTMCK